MNFNDALIALSKNQTVDQKTLRDLRRHGLVELLDATSFDTPPGRKEYIFKCFTDEGQDMLDAILAQPPKAGK